MSQPITHSLPQPPFRDDIVAEIETNDVKRYTMSRPWIKWFIGVQAHESLIPVDSTNGPVVELVPLAKLNAGLEFTYKKISADANMVSVQAAGMDLIDGLPTQNVGAVRWSKLSIRSDGISNWYIV